MPSPALIYTFIRELTASRTLPREPEPDLVMDGPDEVAAYAHAGRIDGVMSASYLFHTARVTQTLHGASTVLDLGCGPATQLVQIAQMNPGTRFVGIDLSEEMLDNARRHVASAGVTNVSFRQGDITRLDAFADASVDGVISTMALHHLPTHALLANCFAEIRRVLKPGGAVYLTDFGRLKRLHSVIHFAYMNAKHQPHLFSLDYERSLRAAFQHEDFVEAARRHLPPEVQVQSTFGVPFLVILKTPGRSVPGDVRDRLVAMKRALPRRYRRDLDDMRTFFRLGGLRQDPFS